MLPHSRLRRRATGKFLEGARTVVEAMLQSPNFLFHTEAGPDGRSVDYDIASRLSYFLWDTMPDQALFDAASKGELRTPAGREAAARRLLADPRARQALDEFFDEWLRFDRVLNASKESRRFPEFSPEMAGKHGRGDPAAARSSGGTTATSWSCSRRITGSLSSDLASLYKLPGAAGTIRIGAFPRGLAPRRIAWAGIFPGGERRARGNLAHAARHFRSRTTALPARAAASSECQYQSCPRPIRDRPLTRRQRMAAHEANPALRVMPSADGSHRLWSGKLRRHGPLADKETILIESATGNRKDDKKIDLPSRHERRGCRDSELEFLRCQATGRDPGAEPGLPGMHRAADFSLRLWPDGNARRRGDHPSTFCHLPRFRLPLQRCC